MATNRQVFEMRISDNGDGTGSVEYQLDGHGIAEIACSIRKEAWEDHSVEQPTDPVTEVQPGEESNVDARPTWQKLGFASKLDWANAGKPQA